MTTTTRTVTKLIHGLSKDEDNEAALAALLPSIDWAAIHEAVAIASERVLSQATIGGRIMNLAIDIAQTIETVERFRDGRTAPRDFIAEHDDESGHGGWEWATVVADILDETVLDNGRALIALARSTEARSRFAGYGMGA